MFRKANMSSFLDALECEAEGLELLQAAVSKISCPSVAVPEVISVSSEELILPEIHASTATPTLMAALGEGLARLHQLPQRQYGFSHDNYIGLSPQKNRWSDNWGEFFLHDRLGYQVSRIKNALVRKEFEQVLARKGGALVAFLNRYCEQPSLLHGDLWAGNALFDEQKAWLIDPAVYYGDREADLAMTEFFGGFSVDFYRAYDQVWPRGAAYKVKKDIYNLYHALNHYNLFGGGYLGQCRQLLLNLEANLS